MLEGSAMIQVRSGNVAFMVRESLDVIFELLLKNVNIRIMLNGVVE